jgi:hypothetical protein
VLGNLAALEPKAPVVRYPRERPGELIHIDVKKLGRIEAIATGGAVPVENASTSVSTMPRLAYSEILRDERKESAVSRTRARLSCRPRYHRRARHYR